MNFNAVRDYVYHTLVQVSPVMLYASTFFFILILTCTWYFFCAAPLSGAIASYPMQIELLKKKKLTAEKKVKSADQLTQHLAALEAVLDTQQTHLSKDFQSLKNELLALLIQHQIKICACSPEKNDVYSRCTSVTTTYVLNGTFESLVKFFAALRELKTPPLCNSCTVARDAHGITATLTLSFLIRNGA